MNFAMHKGCLAHQRGRWVGGYGHEARSPSKAMPPAIQTTTALKPMKTIIQTFIIAAFLAVTASLRAADAPTNWDKKCAACHGKEGKGDGPMGKILKVKDLTDPKVQEALTDEAAVKAIKEGVKDDTGKLRMKAVEGLTDDEITALVKHLRTFKK